MKSYTKLYAINPKTGTGLTVIDTITGTYTTEEVNEVLRSYNKWTNLPIDVICIEPIQELRSGIEALTHSHTKKELIIDNRPDALSILEPKPETLKKLFGHIAITTQGVIELNYINVRYSDLMSPKTESAGIINIFLPDDFKEGDKLIRYCTHLICDPINSNEVKSFKELSLSSQTLKPEDFYYVTYVPKMDRFYWFTAKKLGIFERVVRRIW